MSCERYASEIVDHACGAEIGSDAAAHLRTCTACRRLLDTQQRAIAELDQELQLTLAIQPSPAFVPDVMARVRRPAVGWRRRLWWSIPLAAAAALLVLAFGLLRPAHPRVNESRDAVAVPAPAPPPASDRTLTKPAPAELISPAVVAAEEGERRREVAPPRAVEPARSVQAEVFVAPEASHAVARYLTLVRRGAIDTSTLTDPEEQTVATPGELAIAPLAVDALAIAAVEQRNSSGDERRPELP